MTIPDHHKIWIAMGTVAIGVFIWIGVEFALTERATREDANKITAAVTSLADKDHGLIPIVDGDLKDIKGSVVQIVSSALTDPLTGAVARIDARTAQALGIVGKLTEKLPGMLDAHASHIESIVEGQLDKTNVTVASAVAPFGTLAVRLTGLPDEIRADREYQGLVAELMGLLGASKVTMGQVAKASKTVDEHFPAMLASSDRTAKALADIAESLSAWIQRMTAPQSIKDQLLNWLKVFILAASHIL